MHKQNSNFNINLVLHRFYHNINARSALSWRCSSKGGLSFVKESPEKKTFSLKNELKMNSNSFLNYYIGKTKFIRSSVLASTLLLVLLASAILVPIYNNISITEAATGTAQSSSLTLDVSNSTASVDLSVDNSNGTFVSSDSNSSISFNVSTNNYTGYKLSLSGSNDNQTLVNNVSSSDGTYASLSSISGSVDESTFSANTSTAASNYNSKYGILPSKYKSGSSIVTNTGTNVTYLPAPTTTALVLDETSSANASGSSNNYKIGIGARASYDTVAGTYTGTYILSVVANSVSYSITYDKGNVGSDTISNMPGVQSGNTTSASQTSITLSSTIPTRTGYTFTGWCLGSISTSNNVDSCHDVVDNTNPSNSITAKTFSAGDSFGIDQTTINITTLYAMWAINSNTVSITNGGNIASFSGNGTYNYGSTVNLSATKATNTTCLTYGTPSWSVTSGGVSLSTTSGTSTSFTMPNNAVSIRVSSTATRNTYTITYDSNGGTGTMSNTTGYCGQSTTLRTNTFTRTGYKFLGWSTSKTATSATYTDKQSVNLSRTTSLPLYAVWQANTYNLVVTGDSNLSSMTVKQGSTSGTSISGTKSGNTVTFSSLTYGVSYYLYPVFNSGYEFSSYTKTDSATNSSLGSTSAVNTYYTMGAGNGAITLASKSSAYCTSSDANCMQYYTKATCQTNALASVVALKDARDGNSYTVRYIDGNCWMTSNLRITGTISGTYSNFSASSINISAGDLTSGNSYTQARTHTSGSNVWYNYCAASAGTLCTTGHTASAQDICPSGWRLPSITEIRTLATGDSTYVSLFSAVTGGRYYNGSFDVGLVGSWWSRTPENLDEQYYLYYSTNAGYNAMGYSMATRDYGLYVRCLRSS